MLTQKISKLILLINYSNNQKQNEILKKELKENLNLMTDTHKRLSGEIANDRLSKKNSEKVKNIYLNLETNNLSQEFFDLSQKFIDSKITQNEILYLTQDLNTNLLKKLDLVVSQYQKDSEEEIKKLLLIMQVVSLILVIFAAWEVIVVFN